MKSKTIELTGTMGVAIWATLLLLVTSSLMAGHWVTLPEPTTGSVLGSARNKVGFRGAADESSSAALFVLHFLYGNCRCSQRVLNHVIQRQALKDVSETIVLIDGIDKDRDIAEASGFKVCKTTATKLKSDFGVESAPLLVVTNSQGVILYSGGYTARKQGLDYIDEQVIQSLIHGETVVEYPVFGCAVSKNLKNLIDPFGLKEF